MTRELVGLQKYFVSENERFVEGAIAMLNFAVAYKKNILTQEQWNGLKELICDPYIKDVMGLIKQTYKDYGEKVDKGLVPMQEQQIVKQQVADCNKMLTDAINELVAEGKLKVTDNVYKKRKMFDIEEKTL